MCKERATASVGTKIDPYPGTHYPVERIEMSLYVVWTLAGTLVLMWLLGVTGVLAVGAWVHILLIAAVGFISMTVFTRPRTV
jgi:hypothetical protein